MHEVLDCIRRIVALSPSNAPRTNHEYWLKPGDEMARLHPEEAVAGAGAVAEACTYELPFGEFHFPGLPPERGGADLRRGESSTEVLAKRCWEGVRRRYGSPPTGVKREVEERLQMEFRAIRRGGGSWPTFRSRVPRL